MFDSAYSSNNFYILGSYSCTRIPGTIWNVSDQWCEQNCAGGSHPACNSGSGIFQQCSCENVSGIISWKDKSLLSDIFGIQIRKNQKKSFLNTDTTSTTTTSTTTTTNSGKKID